MTQFRKIQTYKGHDIVRLIGEELADDAKVYTICKPNGWLAAGRWATVMDVCISIDQLLAYDFKPQTPVSSEPTDELITIDLTGPDWEPTATNRFFAQRGDNYAFGPTEALALTALLLAEEQRAREARAKRNLFDLDEGDRDDINELEPLYRAQDARHEERYGPRD